MAILGSFTDVTRIEKTATGIVQFWFGTNLQFIVSEKGNVQPSADFTYLIVTDEDGKTHNVSIYDLVEIITPSFNKPYLQFDRLAGAFTDDNIGVKLNTVYDDLTERVFVGCCAAGGGGENQMNYIVQVDGVEVNSFSYPSSEDVLLTINWV